MHGFAYLTRILMSAGWDARAVDGDSSEVPGVPCAGADALAGARNVVMNWPIRRVRRYSNASSRGAGLPVRPGRAGIGAGGDRMREFVAG